jgi:hypothetical protein
VLLVHIGERPFRDATFRAAQDIARPAPRSMATAMAKSRGEG